MERSNKRQRQGSPIARPPWAQSSSPSAQEVLTLWDSSRVDSRSASPLSELELAMKEEAEASSEVEVLHLVPSSPPPAQQPPAEEMPLIDIMGTEFVTIYVGKKGSPNCKKFSVHKALVCGASPVLEEHLRTQATGFQHKKEMELQFSQDFSGAVQDFINLIYRNRKPIIERARLLEEWITLCRFAEIYGSDDLKDIAIDGLQDHLKMHKESLYWFEMDAIISATCGKPNSKLVRFCTAIFAYQLLVSRTSKPSELREMIQRHNLWLEDYFEFQREEHEKAATSRRVGTDPRNRVRRGDDVTGFPICYFHVHPPNQKCTTKANHGPAA